MCARTQPAPFPQEGPLGPPRPALRGRDPPSTLRGPARGGSEGTAGPGPASRARRGGTGQRRAAAPRLSVYMYGGPGAAASPPQHGPGPAGPPPACRVPSGRPYLVGLAHLPAAGALPGLHGGAAAAGSGSSGPPLRRAPTSTEAGTGTGRGRGPSWAGPAGRRAPGGSPRERFLPPPHRLPGACRPPVA